MQFRIYKTSTRVSDANPHPRATHVNDSDDWVIEIATLEDLVALCAGDGEIVVGVAKCDPALPYVEIYDDYRE